MDGKVRKLEPQEDGTGAIDEIVDPGDGRHGVEGNVGTGDDRCEIFGLVVERDIPDGVVLQIE